MFSFLSSLPSWASRSGARLVASLLLLNGLPLEGAVYYVSPSGSDKNSGTTETRPWQTINKVNSASLMPGDTVLFQGGATFGGSLYFGPGTGGAANSPITIGSYGTGPAILAAGDGSAFYAYNAGGITLRNLVFRGSGLDRNREAGIHFYNDLGGDIRLPVIRLENVEVTGFGREGIRIGSWNGRSGYDGIRVLHSVVHANRKDGMITFSRSLYGHRNVLVAHSVFHSNPGITGASEPTGSGVVLGGVDGGIVEHTIAYNNGAANTNAAGPVGIWAYDSNRIVIQYCESHSNRTQGGDGGGFDLDGGVTNSILQYNYSHGNDGSGFGLYQYAGAPAYGRNVVRYNISQNDGRRNGGGIAVWGASGSDLVRDVEIYHNVVFITAAANNRQRAIDLFGGNYHNIALRNNIFVTSGGARTVEASAPAGSVTFQGNSYWAGGGPLNILWNGTLHTSLDSWRTATGQERLSGVATGLSVNPLLVAPGTAGIANGDRSALAGYRLSPDSPLIDAGLDLPAEFNLDPGASDFFGNPVLGGLSYDIGVSESVTAGDLPHPWYTENFTAEELANERIAGDLATPAGDGMPNLLKYALDLPAKQPAAGAMPEPALNDSLLQLRFRRPADRPGITCIVEVSPDLIQWQSGEEHVDVHETVSSEGDLLVVATDRKPFPENGRRFMRLRVTRTL